MEIDKETSLNNILSRTVVDVNGWVRTASQFQIASEDLNDLESHEIAVECLEEAEKLALRAPMLRRLQKAFESGEYST